MCLQMAKFHFFLWLRKYSILCVCVYVCMCVCVDIYIYIYLSHIFFIHSSVDGYSGCFPILAVVNNAAMNIGVHVSFSICVFVFFKHVPRSGIAGS